MTTSETPTSKSIRIDSWVSTHVGYVRKTNEDFHRCTPARGIFLVADGMGGHAAGEVASSLAVEAAHTALIRGATMLEAFTAAQRDVLHAGQQPSQRGLGTTLIALKLSGRSVQIAWTGDSRIYVLRENALLLLTDDHGTTYGLSEFIGIDKPGGALVEEKTLSALPGDRFLLCSDGLSSYVDEGVIRQKMRGKHVRVIVEELVNAALASGGYDNVTCVVIKVK